MHPTLISRYIAKALEKAVYENDEDMIIASVPGANGFFSQGKTTEEARDNLQDAIEGVVLVSLQMGYPIPDIDGVTIQRVPKDGKTVKYA